MQHRTKSVHRRGAAVLAAAATCHLSACADRILAPAANPPLGKSAVSRVAFSTAPTAGLRRSASWGIDYREESAVTAQLHDLRSPDPDRAARARATLLSLTTGAATRWATRDANGVSASLSPGGPREVLIPIDETGGGGDPNGPPHGRRHLSHNDDPMLSVAGEGTNLITYVPEFERGEAQIYSIFADLNVSGNRGFASTIVTYRGRQVDVIFRPAYRPFPGGHAENVGSGGRSSRAFTQGVDFASLSLSLDRTYTKTYPFGLPSECGLTVHGDVNATAYKSIFLIVPQTQRNPFISDLLQWGHDEAGEPFQQTNQPPCAPPPNQCGGGGGEPGGGGDGPSPVEPMRTRRDAILASGLRAAPVNCGGGGGVGSGGSIRTTCYGYHIYVNGSYSHSEIEYCEVQME